MGGGGDLTPMKNMYNLSVGKTLGWVLYKNKGP